MSVIIRHTTTHAQSEVPDNMLGYWVARGWEAVAPGPTPPGREVSGTVAAYVSSRMRAEQKIRDFLGAFPERQGVKLTGVEHTIRKDSFDGFDGVGAGGQRWSVQEMVNDPRIIINASAASLRDLGGNLMSNFTGAATSTFGKSFETIVRFEGDFFGIYCPSYAQAHANTRTLINGIPLTDYKIGDRATGVAKSGLWTQYTVDDAGQWYHSFNFAERGVHTVRFFGNELFAASPAANALVLNRDAVLLPNDEEIPLLLAMGDSYAEIYRSTMTYPMHLAARLGWRHWNVAQSGSGYVNEGDGTGDESFCSDANMAAARLAPTRPSLITFNGSANDVYMTADPQDVHDRAEAAYGRCEVEWPGVPVHVTGVQQSTFADPAYVDEVDAAIEEAATAARNVVGTVFPRRTGWLTGTGHVGGETGDGNRDFIIGTDDAHLSSYGTWAQAGLLLEPILSSPAGY